MIKILVDCFGGDHSPEANIDGALAALAAIPDLHLILSGDEQVIRAKLSGRSYDESRIEILHAPQIIGCDEDDISIKATTTEKLGFTGREEGISAYAVVLIEKV